MHTWAYVHCWFSFRMHPAVSIFIHRCTGWCSIRLAEKHCRLCPCIHGLITSVQRQPGIISCELQIQLSLSDSRSDQLSDSDSGGTPGAQNSHTLVYSLHQISLQTHNAKPIHSWKDQPLFRPYVGCRASDAKGMNMHLECRWGNQPNQESTHRSSGDTMGTGSFQIRFPSWPSEAGDRLRSNVVSHDRLRSNVVHEKQVSASKMTLGQNGYTQVGRMFVHSFDLHWWSTHFIELLLS